MAKKKVKKKSALKKSNISTKKLAKKKIATSTVSSKIPTPGIGHNKPPAESKKSSKSKKETSTSKKGGGLGAAVRKYVKAIENLAEEAHEIALDKSELFKAAKASGLDTKALRKLISQRKADQAEMAELQETVDLYEFNMSGSK